MSRGNLSKKIDRLSQRKLKANDISQTFLIPRQNITKDEPLLSFLDLHDPGPSSWQKVKKDTRKARTRHDVPSSIIGGIIDGLDDIQERVTHVITR